MRHHVGIINCPRKVGAHSWGACWALMAARSGVFAMNESLSRRQRAVYAAAALTAGYRQHGLWSSPNPVFFDRKHWRKVKGASHVVKLHDAGPWARQYPGYNAARYANATVLRHKGGVDHSFVATHLVSAGHKVEPQWRETVRNDSLAELHSIVREQLDLGRVVWLMGDMNIVGEFHVVHGFVWVRGTGIDKIGVVVPDGLEVGDVAVDVIPLPARMTDHKHAVVGRVTITKEKAA